MKEFHQGVSGGNNSWKASANTILRFGFYCPTMFTDVYKEIKTSHQCQIFDGNRKLIPLPLNPILVEPPFQQWGLDFIREINPKYSGQHRWVLTATDYFKKWIEAILDRRATDFFIIDLLENTILSRFGFPKRIVMDNAPAFK